MATQDYARWFRGSTPYISAHRGKTFVVHLPGEAIDNGNLANIIHDLALLHVLGAQLVVVHGARPQIEKALPDSTYHAHRRITDEAAMQIAAAVCGQIRTRVEAHFSTGLPNSPLHNVDIPVISGNFVIARPIGVVDGVDHLFTGQVRKIERGRVAAVLRNGGILLQSPIGYSPSGQAFNLPAEELAADFALQIGADKLIAFHDKPYIADEKGVRISTLVPGDLARNDQIPAHLADALNRAIRGGTPKAHLVSFSDDGALLAELFTAGGEGTQIMEQRSRTVRPATQADVAGIVEVIRPLEEAGVLLRRERDRLEQEIDHFLVAELDGIVVGCCAVYPSGSSGELACVAVHENYRSESGTGLGGELLTAAEQLAVKQGVVELFVLTTQARDWFLEQGFVDADIDNLPEEKQLLYNWQRNSKVMTKSLT